MPPLPYPRALFLNSRPQEWDTDQIGCINELVLTNNRKHTLFLYQPSIQSQVVASCRQDGLKVDELLASGAHWLLPVRSLSY